MQITEARCGRKQRHTSDEMISRDSVQTEKRQTFGVIDMEEQHLTLLSEKY